MRSTRIASVVVASVMVLSMATMGSEPRQKGRTLRFWLHQYWNASEEERNLKTEAESSVRAIGAKKAVPELLYLVSVKDGPIRQWLEKNGERYHVPFRPKETVTELQLDGISGFEILGTNAAFATGELAALLQDKDLAFTATRCVEHLGKAAEPALCQCLTNQDSSVRHWALYPLAAVTESVELYVERIKPLLQDPDVSVRCSVIRAIGAQTEALDLALPILVPALDSRDDAVATTAAEELGNFSTNATAAFNPLFLLIQGERDNPARAAMGALAKICPDQAVTVLSNTAVNGNPDLLYAAISQLRPFREERAAAG